MEHSRAAGSPDARAELLDSRKADDRLRSVRPERSAADAIRGAIRFVELFDCKKSEESTHTLEIGSREFVNKLWPAIQCAGGRFISRCDHLMLSQISYGEFM